MKQEFIKQLNEIAKTGKKVGLYVSDYDVRHIQGLIYSEITGIPVDDLLNHADELKQKVDEINAIGGDILIKSLYMEIYNMENINIHVKKFKEIQYVAMYANENKNSIQTLEEFENEYKIYLKSFDN